MTINTGSFLPINVFGYVADYQQITPEMPQDMVADVLAGQKSFDLNLEGFEGEELAIRIITDVRNHPRGFVRDQEHALLDKLGTHDITVAGIATTDKGIDFLIVADSTNAALAHVSQLEPWDGYQEMIELAKEKIEPKVIIVNQN